MSGSSSASGSRPDLSSHRVPGSHHRDALSQRAFVPITRHSLKEAVSRRLVLAGVVLSAGFVALFAIGFNALYRRVEQTAGGDDSSVVVAATLLTVLGLYVVRFLSAFLAIFLATGAVSTEIDSGRLQAVLARPLSRPSWLLQRWLAFALITVGYVVIMTLALLVIASAIAGYESISATRGAALLALEMLGLLSLGLLASSIWSTVTSGVVTFSLFGLAWLAGIIEFIGEGLSNSAMRTIGIVTSLVIPSDALWRGASFFLQSRSFVAAAGAFGGIPFASLTPPTPTLIIWSVGHAVTLLGLAVWRFGQRDL